MPTIKKVKPEAAVQMALLQWFNLQYPQYKHYVIKISNENAFRGNAFEMGLHTGTSDLFFAVPKATYHGLWIEVKPPKFKITKSNELHVAKQKLFLERMREMDYMGALCIGIESCISIVDSYFKLK